VFFHQVSAFPRCCVAALRNPAVRAFQHPQHGYAGGGAGWPVWYISVLAGYGGGVGGDELFDYVGASAKLAAMGMPKYDDLSVEDMRAILYATARARPLSPSASRTTRRRVRPQRQLVLELVNSSVSRPHPLSGEKRRSRYNGSASAIQKRTISIATVARA